MISFSKRRAITQQQSEVSTQTISRQLEHSTATIRTFSIHNLLAQGVGSHFEHLLNAPEEDDVIAIHLLFHCTGKQEKYVSERSLAHYPPEADPNNPFTSVSMPW